MNIQKMKRTLNDSMKLRWCLVLFLAAVVLLLGSVYRSRHFLPEDLWLLCWNDSGSVPRGIYLRLPLGTLSDGDYVVFEPKELALRFSVARGWSKPGQLFLKQIGALSGESYSINPDTLQFYANGRYIGQTALRDSENRPLPVLRGTYLVPDGEFLPIGENPRSFDGRYTGTVPVSHIRAKAIPLLTGLW